MALVDRKSHYKQWTGCVTNKSGLYINTIHNSGMSLENFVLEEKNKSWLWFFLNSLTYLIIIIEGV